MTLWWFKVRKQFLHTFDKRRSFSLFFFLHLCTRLAQNLISLIQRCVAVKWVGSVYDRRRLVNFHDGHDYGCADIYLDIIADIGDAWRSERRRKRERWNCVRNVRFETGCTTHDDYHPYCRRSRPLNGTVNSCTTSTRSIILRLFIFFFFILSIFNLTPKIVSASVSIYLFIGRLTSLPVEIPPERKL